jgi:linoleate 10R-lipoxygenase
MLGRLFLRTLPEQFKPDSTYAWFPLMTPGAMDIVLETQGDKKKYDLEKPVPEAKKVEVSTYEEVARILGDTKMFGPVMKRVEKVIKGNGYVCLF